MNNNQHYALLSVSDKTGIIEFAKELIKLNYKILATGNTYNKLIENNIVATEVAEYTNMPEILDGRVKTLHPKIHAGILQRGKQDHDTLKKHDFNCITIVAVNLYPFKATISEPGCTLENAIEKIDIGGPSLIRAAAKNYKNTFILSTPDDYQKLIYKLNSKLAITDNYRYQLAVKAFQHTANYDSIISNYLSSNGKILNSNFESSKVIEFPTTLTIDLNKNNDLNLRYGENPHQIAAVYSIDNINSPILNATKYQGKELSYNNIIDLDSALNIVSGFRSPSCCIIKHNNPCGVAIGENTLDAYNKAFRTDPQSAFGGIIGFNCTVDKTTAEKILANQFCEAIFAYDLTEQALNIFSTKPSIRILKINKSLIDNSLIDTNNAINFKNLDLKSVNGAIIIQSKDNIDKLENKDLEFATSIIPTETEIEDLKFAWHVAQFVKSNAVVFAKNNQTLALGVGQTSRIFSMEIARFRAKQADLSLQNSVLASDAFFPFADNIELAAKLNVKAIIQPKGSIRDNDIIAACEKFGIALVMTNKRHFRH